MSVSIPSGFTVLPLHNYRFLCAVNPLAFRQVLFVSRSRYDVAKGNACTLLRGKPADLNMEQIHKVAAVIPVRSE